MPVDVDVDPLRLKAALRDLIALSAIPALSVGREPEAVVAALADSLVEVLQLDVAFVRMSDPGSTSVIEVTRGEAGPSLRESLESQVSLNSRRTSPELVVELGEGSRPCHGVVVQVGMNGNGGLVVAASARSDFPSAMDRVLLSLAANHAAIAFENAHLIQERDRAESEVRAARDELEVSVVARTAELKIANEELSALRRVAMLVARGVQPDEVFSAVTDEVGRLFGTSIAAVIRFDHDEPALVFVGVSKDAADVIPIGTRWQLEDALASSQVYRSGRSARVETVDWSAVGGRAAAAGGRLGVASTVASPIFVEGCLWGAASVSASEPLPLDAEDRLEKFTELLATAIANADSRDQLTASRARIVTASDEARRRIERDLHDGVQQQLVALGLELARAEARPPAGDALKEWLAGVSDEVGATLDALVEIARGIHPAVLTQGGLEAALDAVARRSAVPVKLEARIGVRVPDDVQVAVYYVVSEALTNVAKHARAAVVHIDVKTDDGTLTLAVRDDGVGGAAPGEGSGLVGLHDRVEALGGTITIDSSAGSGTRVFVTLPIVTEPDPGLIEDVLAVPDELKSRTSSV